MNLTTKRSRKREFLAQVERVVPWSALVAVIESHAPTGNRGRPPFVLETMLRNHFMQQWFTLSDPAMEEALHDVPLFRDFAGLRWDSRLSDESTNLRFRRLLETHKLTEQMFAQVNELLNGKGQLLKGVTMVDATLIAAPNSTKNNSGTRDPEMHQTKKGNQWHFGMKAHVRVDAESGLVHIVIRTAANVHDVVQANDLLHGQEIEAFGDSGYRGVHKREEANEEVKWNVAMMPSKRRAQDKSSTVSQLMEKLEHLKARIRAEVERLFRVIKRQFGHTKVRYGGLMKNTQRLHTLFALSNLWMARKVNFSEGGVIRLQAGNGV